MASYFPATLKNVVHANPQGDPGAASLFEMISGGLAATIFTAVYIACPLLLIGVPVLAILHPWWWVTWALAAPTVLSALLPPLASRSFLQLWPFCHMPKYFNYSEIKELSDDEVKALIGERAVIFCVQPHGVFSFGGASAGVEWAKRWWHPTLIPTAVAASVSTLPLIKHIVGLFGTCDASPKGMTKRLSGGKSAVLYIGGIAELFLASSEAECLFAARRKGFVKLALRTGAEIVPVYFFGNSSVLSVLSNPLLRKFARVTGVTLTWFWGSYGTLAPRPNKILGVVGQPLGIPKRGIAEPTQEQIDQYHSKYLDELTRIFDTYKVYNADYRDKALKFE
jgi:hypothetical protein